jgi:hypothetical protein
MQDDAIFFEYELFNEVENFRALELISSCDERDTTTEHDLKVGIDHHNINRENKNLFIIIGMIFMLE